MITFTVSLFGHREIDNLRDLDEKLTPIIKELLQSKPFVSFLIGRNGEFDEYAASVIKRVQRELQTANSELSLVIPYKVSKIEYYEEYYDNVIIPDCVYGAHSKAAIGIRNRKMIESSDLIIIYLKRTVGGAYTAMKYAKRLNKAVIDLCIKDR